MHTKKALARFQWISLMDKLFGSDEKTGSSATKKSKLTPMMEQYRRIKRKFPEGVLFFRMGDFYEMFEEDALEASKILEIALTKRNGIPMCGIPYHAKDNYLPKIIKAGYKVAICDQVEDPATAKGIVKREIVEIITPGTLTDTKLLDQQNNFLLSINLEDKRLSIAACDISTGDFFAFEEKLPFPYAFLRDEMWKFQPKEIVYPLSLQKDAFLQKILSDYSSSLVHTMLEDFYFFEDRGEAAIQHVFGVTSIKGYGLSNSPGAIGVSGALLHYLRKNKMQDVSHLSSIRMYQANRSMYMGENTIKHLELFRNLHDGTPHYSLLKVLQKTKTAMGFRLLHQYLSRPLLDKEKIKERHNMVEFFVKEYRLLEDIRKTLSEINDIQRIVSKISLSKANPRDVMALSLSLEKTKELYDLLKFHEEAHSFTNDFFNPDPLIEEIQKTIVEEPPADFEGKEVIRFGVSEELDELRDISKNSKDLLLKLAEEEKIKTGISNLKIRYNKIIGYYIEVSKSNLQYVPDYYQRKQQLVGGDRFSIPELAELESKIIGADEKILQKQKDIFERLCQFINQSIENLQELSHRIARLDVLSGFAYLALANNYIRPEITEENELFIECGRHPVVEDNLVDETFIPNDIRLNTEDTQLILVTGPNMSGKSTYLRQTALIVVMAQIGCFVPALNTRIGIVDKIFTRIGASDNLARGESTFLIEMIETAEILNNATSRSLIIMDEIGRGTSTYDGLSLAWSIVEYLTDEQNLLGKTLFATHYHELASLAKERGIACYQVLVKEWENNIIFLHEVVEGSANKSYGIQVARLAGIPQPVITRAKEILDRIESKTEDIEENILQKDRLKEEIVAATGQLSLFPTGHSKLAFEIMNIKTDHEDPKNIISKIKSLQKQIQKGKL